ncbi:MAG: sigma-54 dependent transcriptional regulator [Vicinamibacteria bacterium]
MSTGGVAHWSLMGRCGPMEHLRAQIAQIAPSDVRVHVYGETGTGKEKVARALHRLSTRAGRPCVAVNIAAVPDELFGSEMFGHVKGAFTGAVTDREGHVARADGGTLFMDEVGDMSPLAQARLLRFLQEREYQRVGEGRPRRADVRLISATNVDLEERVEAGRFRADLLFRLRELTLVVPPLRERGGDILYLAHHFLRLQAAVRNEKPPTLAPATEAILLRCPWPGNVRQLEGEMKRLGVVARGREVLPEDLSESVRRSAENASASRPAGLKAEIRQVEGEAIRRALDRNAGVKARAARDLGITRQALQKKLRRLGVLV